MRREFGLPESDIEALEALGLPFETVRDGNLGRVVVHDYPVPPGLTPETVTLNLRIEPAYPETHRRNRWPAAAG